MNNPTPSVALITPDEFDGLFCEEASFIAIMLTRRCNMTCDHCSVASGPGIKDALSDEQILELADGVISSGIRGVLLTGGEPMLREELVVTLLKKFQGACMACAMTSNGFWGDTRENARQRLRILKQAGLKLLTISYDPFHSPFLDVSAVRHISRTCQEFDMPMNLNITRTSSNNNLGEFEAIAREFPNIRMRFYDVQPVGRARKLASEDLRANLEGYCNACGVPAVTDDGRVTACNGPSYFQREGSPLRCGEKGAPIPESIERHSHDPFLEGIRVLGPLKLMNEAVKLVPPTVFQRRETYSGMCEVCLHLSSNPEVVQTLRDHFRQPIVTAEIAAVRRVIQGKMPQIRNLKKLNTSLVPNLLLEGMFHPHFQLARDAAQLLGRADVDWGRLLRVLLACGLARPMMPLLEQPEIKRWAPGFFTDTIRQAGEAASFRLLTARNAIRKIASVLEAHGVRAVLLKTPALTLMADSRDHVPPPGDLDLLVLDGGAEAIHAALLKEGCSLWSEESRGPTPHHLPALKAFGMPLEIHTGIGLKWLGFPEDDMLRDLEPIFGPVYRMRPEATFLHILSHSACHDFRNGYKTAWAAKRILASSPDFDWHHLALLVGRFQAPRGFWSVLWLMKHKVNLPIPEDFLRRKPGGRIQKRMDRLAGIHLLSAIGEPGEKEPFLSPSLILLSQINPLTPDALKETFRVMAKEAWFLAQTSRKSLSDTATYSDLATHELRQFRRTYNDIIAG